MVPLALLALAQPELNCQDAAPPHNPHLHYRQRTKGWVGGGPHDCSYFHADPFACDTLRWADESDREEWEWDVATSFLVLKEWLPHHTDPKYLCCVCFVFLIVVAVVLVVLVCGGCAYYQNAKKKKAVEVGLDADSLKFEGVGP